MRRILSNEIGFRSQINSIIIISKEIGYLFILTEPTYPNIIEP